MSLGYAGRLSYREDLGGQLGAPEFRETPEKLKEKINLLTELILQSTKTVVFTGAGISTSCGIPDFRGPRGIWTLQKEAKALPELTTSFAFAVPSLTHQALKCLVEKNVVHFVVSQNVDGLHLRSGLPPEKLAELHGNCFSEKCSVCGREYIRDFEMETVGFRLTGRRCVSDGCIGRLKDNILDWDDALPEDKLSESEQISSSANLALCLGTSLQITPACDIPIRTVRSGGKLVIVNLQKTPKDKKAFLVIRHTVDAVVAGVMKNLQLKIPRFCRVDRVVVLHRQGLPSRGRGRTTVGIEIISQHGFSCPLPMIASIKLTIRQAADDEEEKELVRQPFTFTASGSAGSRMDIDCCIQFVEELEKEPVSLAYSLCVLHRDEYQAHGANGILPLHPALQTQCRSRLPVMSYREFSITTQEVEYPRSPCASSNGQ